MSQLDELELILRKGIQKSGQSSYSRRAPNYLSLAELNRARTGLRELIVTDSENPRVWELLSRAEECLMDFRKAIQCCEKAIELSDKPTKGQYKRLVLLKQSFDQWCQMSLSPDELKMLGDYLKLVGADANVGSISFVHTLAWLEKEGFQPDEVIDEFERRGAFSDFQVYQNIVLG
tara:strand:+ start:1110 stop:1637 length:528 start_codon:yes stop_codon:yes gene_type:complete